MTCRAKTCGGMTGMVTVAVAMTCNEYRVCMDEWGLEQQTKAMQNCTQYHNTVNTEWWEIFSLLQIYRLSLQKSMPFSTLIIDTHIQVNIYCYFCCCLVQSLLNVNDHQLIKWPQNQTVLPANVYFATDVLLITIIAYKCCNWLKSNNIVIWTVIYQMSVNWCLTPTADYDPTHSHTSQYVVLMTTSQCALQIVDKSTFDCRSGSEWLCLDCVQMFLLTSVIRCPIKPTVPTCWLQYFYLLPVHITSHCNIFLQFQLSTFQFQQFLQLTHIIRVHW